VLGAAIVVYADLASDRLPEVAGGVGTAGCVLTALALALRLPSVLPVGLAGIGASYGVFLGLRTGSVDPRAPLVAAALFAAAELGFWSLRPGAGRSERQVLVRRVAALIATAVLVGLTGSLLLALTSGVNGGTGLEAAGVAAAALTLGAIALLASRSSA
jgi:hypothetical protein